MAFYVYHGLVLYPPEIIRGGTHILNETKVLEYPQVETRRSPPHEASVPLVNPDLFKFPVFRFKNYSVTL